MLFRSLASFADFFAREHDGRAPASWDDFQPYLNLPIDEAYRHIKPTKRYAILSQPVHLPRPYEGELLIITRRPFRDGSLYTNWYGGISHGLRESGRYIIYRTSTGEFRSSYVEETFVQQAFRGFESLLPSPDTEPLRRHESEALWRSIMTWTVAALIAAAFFARRFIWRLLSSPPPSKSPASNGKYDY